MHSTLHTTHIPTCSSPKVVCASIAGWVLLPRADRGLVAGWKTTEAICCLCFLWCPATKLGCQNTQGYPCAQRCALGPAHWSTFIAHWLRWGTPAFCQGPDTIAAVFEKVFVVAGSLHNHAINLNWSSLVEHRKTFSALRQPLLFP